MVLLKLHFYFYYYFITKLQLIPKYYLIKLPSLDYFDQHFIAFQRHSGDHLINLRGLYSNA